MPTSGSGHHHRSGSLRQTNKKNKRSKSSKRSLTKAAGGKITAKSAHHQSTLQQTKADRRHHQVQLREAKKQERLRRLRGWVASSNDTSSSTSSSQRPPRVVGILSLGSAPDKIEEKVRSFLLQGADVTHPSDWATTNNLSTVSARYLAHKKDGALTILTNSTAFAPHYSKSTTLPFVGGDDDVAVLAALDLCRVCDMILFVIDDDDSNTDDEKEEIMNMNIGSSSPSNGRGHSASTIGQEWDHLITPRGDKILAAIKAQGLPTPLTVLAHTKEEDHDDDNMTFQSAKSLNRSVVKRRQALKRFASRFALTEFGTDGSKVLEVDLAATIPNDNDGADDNEYEDRMDDADEDQRTAATGTNGGLSMTTSKAERQSRMAAVAFIRTVCTMAASPPKWVSELPRPYLLADEYTYDESLQELHLTGHVRGRVPLSVNSLLHLPNMGTFQCKSIANASAKHGLFKANRNRKVLAETSEEDDMGTITPDPERQESLTMFATPDALEGEQNLIGFDEAEEDLEDAVDIDTEHDDNKTSEGFARPAGWSDYQSAWLDGVDNDDDNSNDGKVGPGDLDHGELAKELNQPGRRSKGGESAANSVVASDQMDLDDANQVTKEERSALLEQRRKDQSEHLNFPDEVQVNEDENARDRFARYRALKSFKKTYWDPKENLPESYASIFHFASFKATQNNIIKDMKDKVKAANACEGMFWGTGKCRESRSMEMDGDDNDAENDDVLEGCVPVGAYVTLTLKVPKESVASVDANAALTAVALLPHENKVSVLQMGLNRPTGFVEADETPIKSKDLLTFRCGWRTWQGRPVFSQNNINCDKHKFERYLPTEGSFFAASVFGPVTYTPCPVLVFRECREHDSAKLQLVAMGSMIGADADRIIVKRIVLTGFPVKVQKRFATVKYMFYNPDDVRWFKPADLTTKHGLHGNIMESVGEHGTMKCLFNAPIKQHDTVCLQLYKRIYPKFRGSSGGEGSDLLSVRTSNRNQKLLVW